MQNSASAVAAKNLSQVITIDEGQIQQHLGEMVRSTVEETLNAMLDAEADHLCNARRYEHTEARTDQRAGHYKRKLHTKAGWSDFLAYLTQRGLKSPELFISDKGIGLIESLAEYYPQTKCQRCTVHFYRNVFPVVPRGKVKLVAAMPR